MATSTYNLIASTTVGSGGASSITFLSIPGTYTDLVLKISVRESTTNSSVAYISFNGVTTNRSEIKLQGNGSSASSSTSTDIQFIDNASTDTANSFSNAELYIPNYTSSNYKSICSDSVAENNSSTAFMRLTASLWSSTAAITQIAITANSNLAQYSTAYLYGIKNS